MREKKTKTKKSKAVHIGTPDNSASFDLAQVALSLAPDPLSQKSFPTMIHEPFSSTDTSPLGPDTFTDRKNLGYTVVPFSSSDEINELGHHKNKCEKLLPTYGLVSLSDPPNWVYQLCRNKVSIWTWSACCVCAFRVLNFSKYAWPQVCNYLQLRSWFCGY